MSPNPALKKLGLADADRAVIIHADDIGMCQATLPAIKDLFDFGLVSSAALMAPCPWFSQAAVLCREHPQWDVGVHLTLNSEWAGFRWAPLSTRDPASGLLDAAGYFFKDTESTQTHADVAAVERELEAQAACLLAAGLDITHMDTHMGCLGHHRFIPAYVQTALRHRVPPLASRHVHDGEWLFGADPETARLARQHAADLETRGVPVLDAIFAMPLDDHEHRLDVAKQMFDALPAGVSYLILHPVHDTPEIRAMTPDWRCRVADYETFSSAELRDYVRAQGIHVIGWRPLRDLLRSGT
jgi:hypothetical protein